MRATDSCDAIQRSGEVFDQRCKRLVAGEPAAYSSDLALCYLAAVVRPGRQNSDAHQMLLEREPLHMRHPGSACHILNGKIVFCHITPALRCPVFAGDLRASAIRRPLHRRQPTPRTAGGPTVCSAFHLTKFATASTACDPTKQLHSRAAPRCSARPRVCWRTFSRSAPNVARAWPCRLVGPLYRNAGGQIAAWLLISTWKRRKSG